MGIYMYIKWESNEGYVSVKFKMQHREFSFHTVSTYK